MGSVDTDTPRGTEVKAKIFISYSRKDLAFADRLDAALRQRDFEPLIDREQIYAFEDWWERIQSLIAQSDTIIFVLSPDAVASDICAKEVAFAASLHKRFAPVVFKTVDDRAIPESLRQLNFIFSNDETRFEASMDQLAEALLTDIGWIRKHTEFVALARRWETGGQLRGLLLRPPMLEEAEHWLASRPHRAPEPTARTCAFIDESRKNEQSLIAEAAAAQKRKRRLELALVGVLLLLSTAGAAYALWTNFDYLTVRAEMLADGLWPQALAADTERRYAAMTLQPGQIVTFRECSRCPEMVIIPRGEFLMGSPDFTKERIGSDDARRPEGPQHKVTIPANFAVSKFEVTFDEWKACVDARVCVNVSDDRWGRGSRPVINISWGEARQYAKWMSERIGKPGTYRLLTEAEWEYAARANNTANYSWGNGIKKDPKAMANCDGCGSPWDNKQSAPVGSFPANAFGLYDMHGNVWEWLEDCESENYNGAPTNGSARMDGNCNSHIVRGGAWDSAPQYIRSAYRNWNSTGGRYNVVGFRLARTLAQ